MLKTILILILVLGLAMALYTNVGDAQVTAAWGACGTVTKAGDVAAKQFCESLRTGHLLWSITFYGAIAIAGLAAAGLYLVLRRRT